MCGIIGVVRRRSTRVPPELAPLVADLELALARIDAWRGMVAQLEDAADAVERVDAALRGVPGVRALLTDRAGALAVEHHVDAISERIGAAETLLDTGGAAVRAGDLEGVNAALLRTKDATWAVRNDRLRNARAVGDLAGSDAGIAAIEAFTSVQVALSALDRLEVRGPRLRRSAPPRARPRARLRRPGRRRPARPPGCGSRCSRTARRRTPEGLLSLVYKAAAEIGELGDNTRHLRAAIRDDELLHLALSNDTAEVVVLGHTRWASVGIISEPNAHPLNSEELGRADGPYVVGALNGDVDNYADLTVLESLAVPAEITTDAKVIPTLVSHHLGAGAAPVEAFRATAATLEGSVAIGASAVAAPDQLFLALRGSGQALYVGLAEDAFVVASEPYGLVEETGHLPAPRRRDPGGRDPVRRHPGPDRRGRHRARRHPRRPRAARVRRHPAAARRATTCSTRRSRRATSTGGPSRTSSSRRSRRRRRRSARRSGARSSRTGTGSTWPSVPRRSRTCSGRGSPRVRSPGSP